MIFTCANLTSRILLVSVLLLYIFGCEKPAPKEKLIYFGFTNQAETPDDVVRMAKDWGNRPLCPNVRVTITKEEADFKVLFGDIEDITVIDRRGKVLYHGGIGVLELPHGNPDGTGVNLCKLLDE
jgi:hypothetical protein